MLYFLTWFCSLNLFVFFKLYQWPHFPKKQLIFFRHVFFPFVIYFLSLVIIDFIFEFCISKRDPIFWIVEIFLSALFSFFCLGGYCCTLNKDTLKRIFFFDKHNFLKKIPKIFLKAFCVFVLLNPFIQCFTFILKRALSIQDLVMQQVLVNKFNELNPNLMGVILFLFTVIVIVPCFEEFLFRGCLQSFLREKFNNRIGAILTTSFLFALAHFSNSQGLMNIVILLNSFILSICIGWFYEREQFLIAPIFLHTFFNAYTSFYILK